MVLTCTKLYLKNAANITITMNNTYTCQYYLRPAIVWSGIYIDV